jgi:hypothetical protein
MLFLFFPGLPDEPRFDFFPQTIRVAFDIELLAAVIREPDRALMVSEGIRL